MNTHALLSSLNADGTTRRAAIDSLEARLGARLAATLNRSSAELPHDITERLRVAREQALERARRTAPRLQAAPAAGAQHNGGATLSMRGGFGGFWLRAAAFAPLVVLLAGLVLIQEWTRREEVQAAADVDAVLLADDLPPSAWTDPGFREYLKTPQP